MRHVHRKPWHTLPFFMTGPASDGIHRYTTKCLTLIIVGMHIFKAKSALAPDTIAKLYLPFSNLKMFSRPFFYSTNLWYCSKCRSLGWAAVRFVKWINIYRTYHICSVSVQYEGELSFCNVNVNHIDDKQQRVKDWTKCTNGWDSTIEGHTLLSMD